MHELQFYSIIVLYIDLDQLNHILNIIGTPSAEDFQWITNEKVSMNIDGVCQFFPSPQAKSYLQALPYKPTIPWMQLFPQADAKGMSFLTRVTIQRQT